MLELSNKQTILDLSELPFLYSLFLIAMASKK